MQIIIRAAIIVAAMCAVPTMAVAWGKKGHAVVATIAEAHLSPTARSRVQAILRVDDADKMAAVASWADEPAVKEMPGRYMHTVRMSMDTRPYIETLDCSTRCAISGIRDATKVLSTPSSPMSDQIIALKDLIHLIGDIHQPLHTVTNIGGQAVILNGEETTLHTVWDTLIIRVQGQSVKELAKSLDADSRIQPLTSGGPEQWAVEGRDLAMAEIYSEITPARKSAPAEMLPNDYAARHWPTVATRLKQAGLRLSATLNSIYDR